MIVRLMGEGQFELDSKHLDELNKIDNEVVRIVSSGNEKTFKKVYPKLADYVHRYGKPVDSKILKGSDLILPPADLSFEEAKKIFKGDGLIKD